jgi:TRAP-type C4-dicarboxylate transport system permease small subunit
VSATQARPDRPTALRRVVWLLGRIEITVAVLAFSAGVSISALQILLRYTTGASIWWGQEASLLLMIISYFVGASIVFRLRAYVVVDFFMKLFPRSFQFVVYALAQIAVLAFWALVAWQLFLMAPDALRTFTPIMRIPELYFNIPLMYAALSIGLTTLCVLAGIKHARHADSIEELERRLAIPLETDRAR